MVPKRGFMLLGNVWLSLSLSLYFSTSLVKNEIKAKINRMGGRQKIKEKGGRGISKRERVIWAVVLAAG